MLKRHLKLNVFEKKKKKLNYYMVQHDSNKMITYNKKHQ